MMPGLLFMLPIAIGIALIFLGFFLWSVRNGDYEDMEMPAYKMTFDQDEGDKSIQTSNGVSPVHEAGSLAVAQPADAPDPGK
jgi:cbb3-type cytochrome oxidase maturation protein